MGDEIYGYTFSSKSSTSSNSKQYNKHQNLIVHIYSTYTATINQYYTRTNGHQFTV